MKREPLEVNASSSSARVQISLSGTQKGCGEAGMIISSDGSRIGGNRGEDGELEEWRREERGEVRRGEERTDNEERKGERGLTDITADQLLIVDLCAPKLV